MNETCGICGKGLIFRGEATPGVNSIEGVRIRVDSSKEPQRQAWLEVQVEPYKLDHEYAMCVACFLEALGFRPNSGSA